MKKVFLSIILIFAGSAIFEHFLPWWVIAPVAFLVGFAIQQKAGYAFLSGFVAIFLLWTGYAFVLSHANNDILARRIAELLPLKGHVTYLLLLTGLTGGLVSGLGVLSGKWAAELK